MDYIKGNQSFVLLNIKKNIYESIFYRYKIVIFADEKAL
nr:MAG TPA: hypothetical protein [Caudoviricetes sp.]